MGEWAARAITIGSIVFTIASLGIAVLFARKASRVRVGFDVARAAVGVIAILVMAAITNVTTPLFAIVLAITGGLALGFGQGSNLEVTSSERGFFSKRNPIGIALWGAGIVVMQAAGIASRTGMVKIGQTIAWFSVCLGVGLLVGRTSPLRGARQAIAGGGAAMLLAALILPSAAFVGGASVPAVADTPLLTDDEVCDLIAPVTSHLYAATGLLPGRDLHTRMTGVEPLAPVVNAVAACKQEGYETYTGQGFVEYTVYLFASVEDAQTQYAAEVAANEAWYAFEWEEAQESMERSETVQIFIGTGPLDDYDVVGVYWITFPAIRVVMTTTGPFMLYGVVTDTLAYGYGPERPDRTRDPDKFLVETLLIPMSDTAHNIDAYLAATEPPPPEPVDEEPTTSVGVAEPDEDDSASVTEDTQQEQDTALPPLVDGPGDDGPIEPEEAAGQAVAGLVAAAAIGLITLGEASGEIGRILGGMGGGGSTTAPPQEPFIDPYDQKPLETDPETGMVWWPWDGGEGQWVDAAVVPGLLDDWNRELDAETARRVGQHEAQRDRNWADLKDRIRRSEAEDAARIAAEQARFDDFDRRIEAARGWMEQDDAASLPELDQIMQRVADQGFVTDADRARATQILDRTQAYSTALQQRDADDWARIINNAVAVPEMALKGVSILLDPTRGFVSGAVWGWVEAGYDGQGLAGCAGNAAKNSVITGAMVHAGMWGPGQAAMGPLVWGVTSGSVLAAGETLLRGGSLEDARNAMPTGFVFGGLGGMASKASTIGLRQPAQLPKITSGPGGTRTGYSPAPRPSLAPPTRGSIGAGGSSVPVIRVQPGGPTVDFDQPLSPRGAGPQATEGGGSVPVIRVKPGGPTVGHDYPTSPKHIDAEDPRYRPPGTPAEDIPMPPSDWSGTPQPIPDQVGPSTGTSAGRIDMPEPQAPVAPRPAVDLPDAPPAAPTTPRAPADVPEQYGPPRFGDTPEPPPPPTIKEPPILDPDILPEGPKTTPPPTRPAGIDDGGGTINLNDFPEAPPAGADAIPDGWPTETGPAPHGPDQFVDIPDGPPTPPRIDFDDSPVPGMAPKSSPTAGFDDGGTTVAPRPAVDLPDAPPAAPTTPAAQTTPTTPRAPADVPEQYGPPRFGDTPEPPPPPTIKDPPILDPDILPEGPKTTPPPTRPAGIDDGGGTINLNDFPEAPPAGADAIPDGWPTETGPAPHGPDQFVDIPDGPPTPPRIDFDDSPVPGMAPKSSPTAGFDDGGTTVAPRPAVDLPDAPPAAPTTPAAQTTPTAPKAPADVPEQYGPPRFGDTPEPPPPPTIKEPPILDPDILPEGPKTTPPPTRPAGIDDGGGTINLNDFPEAPPAGADAIPDGWPTETGPAPHGPDQFVDIPDGPPTPPRIDFDDSPVPGMAPKSSPTAGFDDGGTTVAPRPAVDLPDAPPAAPTTPAAQTTPTAPKAPADVPEQYGPPRFGDTPEPPPPPTIKDPPILDPEGVKAPPIDGPEPAPTRTGTDVPESAPAAAPDAPEPPAARRPPADAPETLTPAARSEIARGARPTKRGGELLDDMMNQPEPSTGSRPATKPAGLQDWQRGAFPDADGRTLWDAEGRILVPDKNPSGARVGDRSIGRVDPETGALQNLDGDPIQVTVDHRGVPNGYMEMPDAPPGRTPTYNERGEFVGHVDKLGRADIGGQKVPVAIDARGNLVPHDGSGPVPPLSDLDTAPRIPVLDEGGQVTHFVEPGPREIRYDGDGTPHFVQRQHPVERSSMKGVPVDPKNPPPDLGTMPTPEVYDLTEAWFPLSGEGAPPRAPDVVYPTPPGGDPA